MRVSCTENANLAAPLGVGTTCWGNQGSSVVEDGEYLLLHLSPPRALD